MVQTPPIGVSTFQPENLDTFSLLRQWQTYLEVSGTASEVTRRQYLRYVLGFLADTLLDLRSLTEDEVVAWLASKDSHGSMRGMTLRGLKSFYRYSVARGYVVDDPTAALKIRRPRAGDAPSLSREETDALIEAAHRVDPRAPWAIQLAYATGARLGSLCAIEPADVYLDQNWITFRVAKNDKPYGVALGTKGREAVEQLLALIDYLPTTVAHRRPTLVGVGPGQLYNWVRRAGELAGVRSWPHLLRHTTITRLAENSIDTRTIMEIANWDDPRLLRRYARRSDPNVRAAVEVF